MRAAGDRTPVLMLTARDTVSTGSAGLDAGADDYLVKPFALEELRAQLRALLRRSRGRRASPALRGLELDVAAHTVEARPPSSSHERSSCCSSSSCTTRARSSPARDLRPRLGLRLRADVQLARRLRGLPAAKTEAAASRACCRPYEVSGTCCVSHEPPRPLVFAPPPPSRSPSSSPPWSSTARCARSCAGRSTTRCRLARARRAGRERRGTFASGCRRPATSASRCRSTRWAGGDRAWPRSSRPRVTSCAARGRRRCRGRRGAGGGAGRALARVQRDATGGSKARTCGS